MIAPLAIAGLVLVNAGLGRARNAAHAMLAALCAASLSACVYFAVGRCWQGSTFEPALSFTFAGHTWNWLGAARPFFLGLAPDDPVASLSAWLGLLGASLVAAIPLGAGGERWRLASICISTALLSGFVYPLVAHWTWSGGWLMRFGLVDSGGVAPIHVTGGLTALSVAWLLGPRRGKYSSEGMPMAIPGHSVVFVLFGCMVAAAGWLSLNVAAALIATWPPLGHVAQIAVNTMLSASAAALAAAFTTRIRFGRPDASLTANGWVGGLVAVSAGCAVMPPAAAMLTGLIAGALVALSVEMLELRLEIDDPGGSISVHAVAGIWGLLATGLFSGVLAQLVGIATLIGFVLPLVWGGNALLNRWVRMRVPREGERQGLDLYELGAGAYPDFVTHSDDHREV